MKKIFKWKITITLEAGTEIETQVVTDSLKKAANAMQYTAERLNGSITKIERDVEVKDKERSSDQ